MDLLISGITISAERESVVDFTYPFWEEKLALVTLTEDSRNFPIFRPLHYIVWICYVGVALVAALGIRNQEWLVSVMLNKSNSGEYMTLRDCIWYTYGAMWYQGEDSLRLTHWGRDKMAAISQTTLSNAFSWMKMLECRLKFHWSLFPRVQLTIFQHWFRQWLCADQATSHYLNQWWLDHRRIYVSFGLNELTQSGLNEMFSNILKYISLINFLRISVKFLSKVPVDNSWELVKIMA